jgi:hypothetical protein
MGAQESCGVRCEVAAPSKLQGPSGDRGKTDARDAVHLARLLRMDEITPVAVPTADEEAARDLVRAREDCRGGLMRARHRPGTGTTGSPERSLPWAWSAWRGSRSAWEAPRGCPHRRARHRRAAADLGRRRVAQDHRPFRSREGDPGEKRHSPCPHAGPNLFQETVNHHPTVQSQPSPEDLGPPRNLVSSGTFDSALGMRPEPIC